MLVPRRSMSVEWNCGASSGHCNQIQPFGGTMLRETIPITMTNIKILSWESDSDKTPIKINRTQDSRWKWRRGFDFRRRRCRFWFRRRRRWFGDVTTKWILLCLVNKCFIHAQAFDRLTKDSSVVRISEKDIREIFGIHWRSCKICMTRSGVSRASKVNCLSVVPFTYPSHDKKSSWYPNFTQSPATDGSTQNNVFLLVRTRRSMRSQSSSASFCANNQCHIQCTEWLGFKNTNATIFCCVYAIQAFVCLYISLPETTCRSNCLIPCPSQISMLTGSSPNDFQCKHERRTTRNIYFFLAVCNLIFHTTLCRQGRYENDNTKQILERMSSKLYATFLALSSHNAAIPYPVHK